MEADHPRKKPNSDPRSIDSGRRTRCSSLRLRLWRRLGRFDTKTTIAASSQATTTTLDRFVMCKHRDATHLHHASVESAGVCPREDSPTTNMRRPPSAVIGGSRGVRAHQWREERPGIHIHIIQTPSRRHGQLEIVFTGNRARERYRALTGVVVLADLNQTCAKPELQNADCLEARAKTHAHVAKRKRAVGPAHHFRCE